MVTDKINLIILKYQLFHSWLISLRIAGEICSEIVDKINSGASVIDSLAYFINNTIDSYTYPVQDEHSSNITHLKKIEVIKNNICNDSKEIPRESERDQQMKITFDKLWKFLRNSFDDHDVIVAFGSTLLKNWFLIEATTTNKPDYILYKVANNWPEIYKKTKNKSLNFLNNF